MKRAQAPEILDAAELVDPGELCENLRDMGRLAHVLGIFDLALRLACEGLPALRLGLDIGCGDGALMRYAASSLQWIGVDISRCVLRYAGGQVVQASGLHLPFADRSVDVVTCIHVLHHLSDENVEQLFAEMARVARLRWVCLDLQRSKLARLGAWILVRLTSRNRLTRHDGPLSVCRAYTLEEVRALAKNADVMLTNCGTFRGFTWWMVGGPR